MTAQGFSMNGEETLTPLSRLQLVPKQHYTHVQRKSCLNILRQHKINLKGKRNKTYRGPKFLTWEGCKNAVELKYFGVIISHHSLLKTSHYGKKYVSIIHTLKLVHKGLGPLLKDIRYTNVKTKDYQPLNDTEAPCRPV